MPCEYDEVCPPGSVEPGDPCNALYERSGQVGVEILIDVCDWIVHDRFKFL